MSEKLSIAIPTYNRLAYLKESMNSILSQTFQDFSIFVFDNASDEPIEQEIEKFNDDRIHFIGNDKNIEAFGNFNRIINYPFNSEYVIIFHDDDTMHPKMLELEVAFLDAHKDVQFVVSDLNRGTDNKMHVFLSFAEDKIKSVIYKNKYEFIRAQMNWLRYSFPSAMYRKEALKNAQMKQEFLHFWDMVFLAEISQKGPCAFLAVPLMNYRIHSGQHTERFKEGYKKGVKKLLSFLKENLSIPPEKRDEYLFRKHAVNSLLRACAHVNSGLFESVQFLKESRREKLLQWRDFQYIDARGIVSILSIVFKSRKIIDTARWLRNLFQ